MGMTGGACGGWIPAPSSRGQALRGKNGCRDGFLRAGDDVGRAEGGLCGMGWGSAPWASGQGSPIPQCGSSSSILREKPLGIIVGICLDGCVALKDFLVMGVFAMVIGRSK